MLSDCMTCPSTVVVIASAGRTPPGSSSGVTSTGPMEVVESQFLPWVHSRVRNCQSRQVTSFITVKPAMAASASCADARRTGAPMTTTNSASQSNSEVSSGRTKLMVTFEETVTLSVRTDRLVRFIAEVECTRALRIGHRTGMAFPAHRTSGGLAMLAELTDEEVAALYAQAREDEEVPDVHALFPRLESVRQQGFSLNNGLSEKGLLGVGRALRDPSGVAVGALGIAMPSSRFSPPSITPMVAAMNKAARAIEAGLARSGNQSAS